MYAKQHTLKEVFMSNLKALVSQKNKLIADIHSFANLMKGSVYQLNRKCSNKKCQCNKDGSKHSSFVLTYSKKGKTKILSLKKEQEKKVRKLTINYNKFKDIIFRLTNINIEIIKLEKKMEAGD